MGAIRFSIDADLVRLLTEELPLEVFVETGTYEGGSVRAMLALFNEIHTIELSSDLAKRAEEEFASTSGVNVHQGRSENVLTRLRPKLKGRPALFWLDAHWSDEPQAVGGDGQCPLLGEIEAIDSLHEQSVVMIDDARLFLSPPPPPADASDWPDLSAVLERLRRLRPEHELMVIDDVIVFFQPAVQEALRDYAVANAGDGEYGGDAPAREAVHGLGERIDAIHRQLEDAQQGLQSLGAESRATHKALVESGLLEAHQELRALTEIVASLGRDLQAARGEVASNRSEAASKMEALVCEVESRLDAFREQVDPRLARIDNQVRNTRIIVGRLRDEQGAGVAAVAELRDELGAFRKEVRPILEAQRARGARGQKFLRVLGAPFRPIARLTRASRERWRVRLHRLLGTRPKLGRLHHHPPMPLQVPERYRKENPPESPPTISIVTPSFNQGRYLERTIESVLDQAYPQLEYMVQDGGSTDETREVLERCEGRLHHWEMREDKGQGHAINVGMARTSGEIMAWLNSDDLLLPGSLCYVARYFSDHPDVDALYGHRVLIDEDDQEIGRWVLPRHGDELLSWADFIPQETLFWRRRIWEQVGASMDEHFRFALDWDLLLRFRDAGARIVRVPRFLGAFRVHTEQKTNAQWDTAGETEMALIRTRELNREVTTAEIGERLRWYLRRHVVLHKLYRAGVLRY